MIGKKTLLLVISIALICGMLSACTFLDQHGTNQVNPTESTKDEIQKTQDTQPEEVFEAAEKQTEAASEDPIDLDTTVEEPQDDVIPTETTQATATSPLETEPLKNQEPQATQAPAIELPGLEEDETELDFG